MIKNIVFDLGNVLIEFNPLKYLEKFEFDEKTKKILYKVIFQSNDWIEYDRGIYKNNTDKEKKSIMIRKEFIQKGKSRQMFKQSLYMKMKFIYRWIRKTA